MARVSLQQALCIWEHGSVLNAELIVRDTLGRNSNYQSGSTRICLCGAGTSGDLKTRSSRRSKESTKFWSCKGYPHVKWCSKSKRNLAGHVIRKNPARTEWNGGATAAFDEARRGDSLGDSQEAFAVPNYGYERETDNKVGTYLPEDRGISNKRLDPERGTQRRARHTRYAELDTFDQGGRLRDGYSGTGGATEDDPVGTSGIRSSSNTSDLELDRGISRGEYDEDVFVDDRSGGRTPLRDGGPSRRHPTDGTSPDVGPYEPDRAFKRSARGAISDFPSPHQSRAQLESRSTAPRRDKFPWWRVDHTEAESSSTGLESDEEPSASGLGTKLDYETGNSWETGAEKWKGNPIDRQGASGYMGGNESRDQNRRNQEVSVLSDDKEPRGLVRQIEKSERYGLSKKQYSTEEEVLERGLLYAKQVINQATAQSFGVVTQVWVDLGSLKVVALEVRANLLFGNFDSILLNSLSKVGDVILIHNESAFVDDQDLFNCYDLVGSDIFTENGTCLGKVRDYDFRLEDGAVLSLEFDRFGVPIIPSNVISTYSLTADEVIQAQEGGLLVRKGAEKRIRKMTKGLFSRPRQPPKARQYPSQQSRRQLPGISSASSPISGAGALYRGQSDALEREDGNVASTSPATEVLYRRKTPNPEQRAFVDSPTPSRYENRQGQDLGSPERLATSSKFENTPEKRWEDSNSRPLAPLEPLSPEASTRPQSKRPQLETNRTSAPTLKFSGRGLPMSYRKSPPRVEKTGP